LSASAYVRAEILPDFVQDFKDFPDSQDFKILFSLTAKDLSGFKISLLKIFQDFPKILPKIPDYFEDLDEDIFI
jgi:hypothetical protein